MLRRFTLILTLVGLLGLATAPAVAAARPTADVNLPVSGTVEALDGIGEFTGTFSLDRFASQGGELVAIGTLTGTLTDAAGNVIGTVTDFPITLPVSSDGTTGSCDILHLELGPLDLDLLGLQVHLDQVVLDIDAQQGPGNLLGNLLCAVAGLLDGGLNTGFLANLLNQILAILG